MTEEGFTDELMRTVADGEVRFERAARLARQRPVRTSNGEIVYVTVPADERPNDRCEIEFIVRRSERIALRDVDR